MRRSTTSTTTLFSVFQTAPDLFSCLDPWLNRNNPFSHDSLLSSNKHTTNRTFDCLFEMASFLRCQDKEDMSDAMRRCRHDWFVGNRKCASMTRKRSAFHDPSNWRGRRNNRHCAVGRYYCHPPRYVPGG